MIGGINSLTTGTTSAGTLPVEVVSAINDMGTVDKAGAQLVLFLPWLISMLGGFAFKILVFLRFAEIYILTAAATLPMAFLGNSETKGIAIGFLKRYGTVILQGAVIMIIIAVYAYFQFSSVDWTGVTGDTVLTTITSQIGDLMLGPIFFVVLLFTSSRLAKALIGES